MINCQKCGAQYEKQFQHEKECVPKESKYKELKDQINQHLQKHGEIQPIIGAYGNNSSPAFVERKIKTEYGLQTKLYGCSFLYPVNVEFVDEVAITKASYMGMLKLALENPLILLRPKKIVKFLARMYYVDLAKKVSYTYSWFRREIKYDELTPLCRSIVDVGRRVAEEYPLKYPKESDEYGEVMSALEFRQDIIHIFEALASFIQRDGGYYFLILDFFQNIDKGVSKAFDLVMERDKTYQLKDKIKLVKVFFFMARFTPLRKVMREIEKIRITPTESERYFAYRKEYYDFDGVNWEERKIIFEKIDEERKHIIIK
jgi:hypothetical protein